MSLSKAKGGAGLPKSVKVRSTCNACQQAKIRCSHEKPSCRRCLKHNIDCIYSVSRRLGRPAKKKEPRLVVDEQGSSPTPETFDPELERRPRRAARKRGQKSSGNMMQSRVGKAKVEEQYASISENAMDDSGMSSPLLASDLLRPAAFDMDLNSETWLQEIMSNRFSGVTNPTLHETFGDVDVEDTFDTLPDYMKHPGSMPPHPTDSYFPAPMSLEMPSSFHDDLKGFQNPDQMGPMETKDEKSPWVYAPSSMKLDMQPSEQWSIDRGIPNNLVMDHTALNYCPLQSPDTSQDSDTYSPDETDFFGPLDNSLSFSCNCYKQAMSELIRSGINTGPDGSCSMDSILACQKDFLLQTESILECKMCSQSEVQANMLMIIIVTIDSLLSTFDLIATASKPDMEDVSADQATRRSRGISDSSGSKAHIDCPMVVNSFGVPVPAEEKSSFIRQVLQVRLSMLLLTIRRIRVCMQQHLTAVLSRGRLLMIMETDRRLQLILMKVRMASG